MLEKYNKNKNPFSVPDIYFAGLTEDIMNCLPNKVETKRIPLWRKVAPWSAAIAAAIIAVVVSVNFLSNNMPDTAIAHNAEEQVKYYSSDEEEDYIMFLEEESMEALYVDALLDN